MLGMHNVVIRIGDLIGLEDLCKGSEAVALIVVEGC